MNQFELMENVTVKYNATMFGGVFLLGESSVQVASKGLTVAEREEISTKLREVSIHPAIKEHFKSIN